MGLQALEADKPDSNPVTILEPGAVEHNQSVLGAEKSNMTLTLGS